MGNSMMYIASVFAQLERETIQMRVTDAYISRSKHGFFMGGKVPYGFKLEPYSIGGKKTSRYVVVPEEAEIIKLIYQMYAQPQTSLGDLMRYLADNGILTRRGKNWNRTQIGEMLKNPAYLMADLDVYEFYKSQGTNIINDPSEFIGTNGCYLYNSQEAKAHKKQSLEGQTLVIAPHEGFVPSRDWIAARKKCLNNRCFSTSTKAKNSWLVGLAKCGHCHYALSLMYSWNAAKTKQWRYFGDHGAYRAKGCVKKRLKIRPDEVERIVFAAMKDRLESLVIAKAEQQRPDSEAESIRAEIIRFDDEIRKLMDKLADADNVLFGYIQDRVNVLHSKKSELEEKLRAKVRKHKEIDTAPLADPMSRWDTLTVDEKHALAVTMIDVVYVSDEYGVDIQFSI